MDRRTVLASTGGIAVGLLAGCLSNESDLSGGSPGDGRSPDSSPTDRTASEDGDMPRVVDHRIETEQSGCKSEEEDSVDVTFDEDGVVLDGVAAAPTPCHEATIQAATVEEGTLTVAVGLEAEDGICVECVGVIEYAATIEIEKVAGVETVVVEHADPGGTHTVERDDGSPSPDGSGADRAGHEDAM